MIGYKVMRKVGDKLHSLANDTIVLETDLDGVVQMPGLGIWLSNNKQFVLDYYSGYHDDEVLVKMSFEPTDVTSGNLDDIESVFTAKTATIIDIQELQSE